MTEEEDREIRRQQVRQAIERIWDTDAEGRAPAGGFRIGSPNEAPSRRPSHGGGQAAVHAAAVNTEQPMLSAAELGRRYRTGELSPVEATRQALDRAEASQARVNAFITILNERAMAAAKAAEDRFRRGQGIGPLDGVPVAIKDLIDVAGVPTTAASKVLLDNVARQNAPVIDRLEAGGAVIFGKTNLHEFAYGGTGDLSYFGPARNPRNPGHMPGGSSSGSAAAVGQGVCPVALGTDTAGSVRIPAAACGIVGLKPTYGRVSTERVVPLSWSLDHVGPMTATVEDAGLALSVMCDFDAPDLNGEPKRLRVGIVREHFFSHLDADVRRVVEGILPALGDLEDVQLPHTAAGVAGQTVITGGDASAYHRRWLNSRAADYDPGIRHRLEAALQVTGADYVQAMRIRGIVYEEMLEALRHVDVLAMPSLPVPAPTLFATEAAVEDGSLNTIGAMIRNTMLVNMSGFPAISVPCGTTPGGLPVGLQLVCGPWQEAKLLQIAHWFEVR